MIGSLVQQVAPQLLEPYGIRVETAAEILFVAGTALSGSSLRPLSPNSRASLPCPPAPA